jgi:hypothetical protein
MHPIDEEKLERSQQIDVKRVLFLVLSNLVIPLAKKLYAFFRKKR